MFGAVQEPLGSIKRNATPVTKVEVHGQNGTDNWDPILDINRLRDPEKLRKMFIPEINRQLARQRAREKAGQTAIPPPSLLPKTKTAKVELLIRSLERWVTQTDTDSDSSTDECMHSAGQLRPASSDDPALVSDVVNNFASPVIPDTAPNFFVPATDLHPEEESGFAVGLSSETVQGAISESVDNMLQPEGERNLLTAFSGDVHQTRAQMIYNRLLKLTDNQSKAKERQRRGICHKKDHRRALGLRSFRMDSERCLISHGRNSFCMQSNDWDDRRTKFQQYETLCDRFICNRREMAMGIQSVRYLLSSFKFTDETGKFSAQNYRSIPLAHVPWPVEPVPRGFADIRWKNVERFLRLLELAIPTWERYEQLIRALQMYFHPDRNWWTIHDTPEVVVNISQILNAERDKIAKAQLEGPPVKTWIYFSYFP
ncbi:hypothetical protein B0H13DRAFT_1851088 [Mycena leptocephala]|nr:hypothetical protein B0H13DRAFT_1851088 [Mycena leptocephala]